MNQSESHPFGAYTVAARQADRAMIELLTLDYLSNGGAITSLDPQPEPEPPAPARQKREKHVYQGEQIKLRDVAKMAGIHENSLRSRMTNKGLTLEEAIAMGPPRGSKQ